MYRPTLVTPPAERPVSVEEARLHLRVDSGEEDMLIQGLIDAAVSHLDGYSGILGRCLVTQTWELLADRWDAFRLPFPNVQSVAISYLDASGGTVVVPTSDYRIVARHAALNVSFGSAWSAPSLYVNGHPAITLTITAGYGDATDVPQAIKQAILLLVGHWYARREAVGDLLHEMPMSASALLAPFRVARI